jgi:hypothetical protein
MPRPVSTKLGAWLAAASVGLLTSTTSIDTVRARDKGLSLADLAGPISGSGGGFLTVCLNANLSPTACTDPSSVAIQFNDAQVLQGTRDTDGNYCIAFTDVDAPLGVVSRQGAPLGGSTLAATVTDFIVTGSTTSYDPTTGRGSIDMTLLLCQIPRRSGGQLQWRNCRKPPQRTIDCHGNSRLHGR